MASADAPQPQAPAVEAAPTIPEAARPAAEPVAPPARRAAPWLDKGAELAAAGYAWLMRPRVRLAVTGVTLLLIGGLVMANSVWTLPLVIVGVLMVVVTWIGHRLEGHFAVEWGETGTQLAFRATIKAAQPQGLPDAGSRPEAPALEPERAPAAASDDVIDGEAHTVEIDVAELKALIAAAESAETVSTRADEVARDIRIRRIANGTPHPIEQLRSTEP
jgi:hypothetical protein